MKKNDFVLIIFILLAAAVAALIFFLPHQGQADNLWVRVIQDGQTVAAYPLSQDHTETLTSDLGFNVLVIEDHRAFIKRADCGNQVCVNTAPISQIGETIACLPHKLIVEISPEK